MRLKRSLPLILVPFASVLFSTGCARRVAYYAPPPPPPAYQEIPPLVQLAQREGFRLGNDDGARDAYYRSGYHPKSDPGFRETPGYDPRLGPFPPYREAFRAAYLNGYDRSFRRPA